MSTKKLVAAETTKKVVSSKSANNSVNFEIMEKVEILTPREVLRMMRAEKALSEAEKALNSATEKGFDCGYTFEDARIATKGFTIIFTTGESEDGRTEIDGKVFYHKVAEPTDADIILRSYESYKLIYNAKRIMAAREAKVSARRATIEAWCKSEANTFGLTLEMAMNMAEKGLLNISKM